MKIIEEITKAFKSDFRLKCLKCGGYLVQNKCDAYSHGYGFYKVWTCLKCGEEWTDGSGIKKMKYSERTKNGSHNKKRSNYWGGSHPPTLKQK